MSGPGTFRLWIAFGTEAFDEATLDAGDGAWTDVTDYVRAAQFSTSTRSSRFDAFSAGQGTFVLDNATRLFDPAYAAGTHYGDFRRNTPIRVTGEHSAARSTVWTGFATSWTSDYLGRVQSSTVVKAVDGLGLLARYELDLVAAAYEGDTAADRIGRVLDAVGWPSAWRDLNNGGATSVLEATTWGTNALGHITDVTVADGGLVYCDTDGTLRHDSRNAPAIESRQASTQESFDDSTATTYESLKLAGVGDGYRDLIRISGASRTVQEVDNVATNAAPVVFQKLGTPLRDDSAAADAATFYADLFDTETPFPNALSTTIATHSDDLRTELVPRQVRDRVDVTYGPPGGGADITADVFVDAIRHDVTPARWRVEYLFSSADEFDALAGPPSTWLVVGDATLGKVATGTVAY